MFSPKELVLVSLGTLTFIKPVIKKIRSRDFQSRILQIPMVDASGKLSYPLEVKEKMFSFAYQSLKEWHKDVYFYMCMEEKSLWKKVFGYEYPTNESFEMDMKLNYMKKVRKVRMRS
jgi:spore photoproduct lyase